MYYTICNESLNPALNLIPKFYFVIMKKYAPCYKAYV